MATPPAPAPTFDNEFKVSWDNQRNLIIHPTIPPKVNQRVKCTNATGDHEAVLTLTFVDDSPFTEDRAGATIKQDEVRKFVKTGDFFCGCTLIYRDGKQEGWKPTDGKNSKQGGIIVIRPFP